MAFINSICSGTVTIIDADTDTDEHTKTMVMVSGKIDDTIPISTTIHYIAAAPGNRLTSYTGSLLPYPNSSHAFDNTPTNGALSVNPQTKQFTCRFQMPNSYYGNLGSALVPPTLYLQCRGKNAAIVLNNSILFRSLTYPETRKDVSFYDGMYELPVRTQERILKSSPFHTDLQATFWGVKPPV